MWFKWLIIETILISYFKLNVVTQTIENNKKNNILYYYENNNSRGNYNSQRHLENKCVTEIPKVYLEYNRNYTLISDDTTTNHYYSKIEVCCDGYKRSKYDWNKCVPICDDCDHGICVEPGYCKCFPNYIKNHEGRCVLTCPVYCDNGRCKADGTCRCNSGYELDKSEKFCRPHCSKKLECNPNFYQYCSGPDTCSCIEGYQISRSRCEPICKYNCGINGTCESPNICKCYNGAILKNGICQAVCYQKCDNGICKSPNRCICFEGFIYDQRTTSCIPEEGLLRTIDMENLD